MFMLNKNFVVKLLENLFCLRGWMPAESSAGDLTLMRDGKRLVVLYAEHSSDVLEIAGKVSGEEDVLVVFDSAQDASIASAAYELGFEIWDRPQLEQEIGKTVLDACSKHSITSPPELSELYEEDLTTGGVRVNLPSVPPAMRQREALSRASEVLGSVAEAKLLFTPHWKYSYHLRLEKKFKNRSVSLRDEGTGLLNAITGERWDTRLPEILDAVNSPTENYEIRELSITKEDAYSRILKYVVDKNKKEVRINEMIGDTIVFEQKNLAPDARDVNLSLELVYLPVWHITGEDGRFVEFNAVNKQRLQTGVPVSEDVEFIA